MLYTNHYEIEDQIDDYEYSDEDHDNDVELAIIALNGGTWYNKRTAD